MEGRFLCFVLAALQLMSWVTATSRPFAPNHGFGVYPTVTAQSPESESSLQVALGPELSIKEGYKGMEGEGGGINSEEAYTKWVAKLGSSPPSCEHKCYGCSPCEAIQVPTTSSSHSHVGVQYANYEPEGWKCKCGPSFYSP